MRDWKEISRLAAERHPGGVVILESPHLGLGSLPEGTALCRHEQFTKEFEGSSLNPKEIRRFLWEIRNRRQVLRDRAFVETEYDEESDTSRIHLGTLTSKDALERLGHGTTG